MATHAAKRATATRGNRAQVPRNQNNEKPPRVSANIEWVQKGVGWDCREIYYEGGRRRRRHVGHLGRKRYEEMRRNVSAAVLAQRLGDWIAEQKLLKQIPTQDGDGPALVM